MANTFTKIATVTVNSGGTSSIQFTSIPATYTDLCVLFSIRLTVADTSMQFTLNNNTGTVNNFIRMSAVGTVVDTAKRTSSSTYDSMICNPSTYTANTFGNVQMYIPNYASSIANKNWSLEGMTENNASSNLLSIISGMIADSNPVTSLKIFYSGTSNDIAQYSTATLYGISNS